MLGLLEGLFRVFWYSTASPPPPPGQPWKNIHKSSVQYRLSWCQLPLHVSSIVCWFIHIFFKLPTDLLQNARKISVPILKLYLFHKWNFRCDRSRLSFYRLLPSSSVLHCKLLWVQHMQINLKRNNNKKKSLWTTGINLCISQRKPRGHWTFEKVFFIFVEQPAKTGRSLRVSGDRCCYIWWILTSWSFHYFNNDSSTNKLRLWLCDRKLDNNPCWKYDK